MIEIRQLSKSFADRDTTALALDGITLTIEKGSFFTLLGPSGCGKTTLLRCIAGLEQPDEGEIRIGDTVAFSSAQGIDVPINRRRIGMVFQSYAIWPHMSVYDNVAFPLLAQKQGNVRERVMQALGAVGLATFADRPATRLSGGQQQRVALARGIVAEPSLLLLDEPLSNLDAGLREQMRDEMRRLQQQLGLTTVLVTHDQDEALSLSDRIALLRGGKVVEVGTPQALYAEPKTVFAAEFVGAANILDGEVGPPSDGLTPISVPFGQIFSTMPAPAGPAKIMIRPEKIRFGGTGHNRFAATIVTRKFLGGATDIEVELRHAGGTARLRSRGSDATHADDSISIDPADVRILSAY